LAEPGSEFVCAGVLFVLKFSSHAATRLSDQARPAENNPMNQRVDSNLGTAGASSEIEEFHPIMHPLKTTAVVVCCLLTMAARAQEKPAPPSPADTPPGNIENDAQGPRPRRANFNPADVQARRMSRLRERFEVTDDAEWQLISDRITKVMELRRSVLAGGMRQRTDTNAAQGNPEQDALSTAVTDKLPDAEVKARLERLRAARKESEAKLDQAREDLRAVLTIRQEAIAVLAGILP
jgi:hypothetical protein